MDITIKHLIHLIWALTLGVTFRAEPGMPRLRRFFLAVFRARRTTMFLVKRSKSGTQTVLHFCPIVAHTSMVSAENSTQWNRISILRQILSHGREFSRQQFSRQLPKNQEFPLKSLKFPLSFLLRLYERSKNLWCRNLKYHSQRRVRRKLRRLRRHWRWRDNNTKRWNIKIRSNRHL